MKPGTLCRSKITDYGRIAVDQTGLKYLGEFKLTHSQIIEFIDCYPKTNYHIFWVPEKDTYCLLFPDQFELL
jgi:hypothetical protein